MDRKTDLIGTQSLSVAIVGSGGSGVVTMGKILLESVARCGLFALLTRSSGPQIRGGESAVMLRIASHPVDAPDDSFNLLLALDWENITRFSDEIPITESTLILSDPKSGAIPEAFNLSIDNQLSSPFQQLAKEIEGGRANMVALGQMTRILGLPLPTVRGVAEETLKSKGREVIDATLACIERGYAQHLDAMPIPPLAPATSSAVRWNISGNEACGLGALQGGVRFVAAYPITPASEILEWLAPNLERVDGNLVQAEDELASINMIIGASYGGVPALTATSGPGLSLMMEGLGLAVASETPVVLINVMRGGPSTGIPTKSEQSDLNLALYGLHGDAPHVVLSTLSISDSSFTSQWAVQLAERLQCVAIVLTDQALGQARAIIAPPRTPTLAGQRKRVKEREHYHRYALTDDAISPMAIPGDAECMFTADGLEHNESGTPSSTATDHQQQLDKRRNKLTGFDFGDDWAEITGSGEIGLITWGSTTGATREAAQRLTEAGHATRTIAVRLLSPLSRDRFKAATQGIKRLLVVEQNHSGQFFEYLNAQRVLPENAESLARPGPLPLRPNEIVNRVMQGL